MPKLRTDLTGKSFNSLTVLKFSHYGGVRCQYWTCQCSCGTIVTVRKDHLVAGDKKDCGHVWRVSSEQYLRNQLFAQYRFGALKRSLSFLINYEEFEQIVKGPCFYCGQLPKQEFKSTRKESVYVYNGIDRLNNAKGYDISNIVPCCKVCNRAKSDMNYDDFISWIERICSHDRKEIYTNGLSTSNFR